MKNDALAFQSCMAAPPSRSIRSAAVQVMTSTPRYEAWLGAIERQRTMLEGK